jgi:PAS domain S-box-containing protein
MTKSRILIVEDDLMLANGIEVTLYEHGYDVISKARTGQEAVKEAIEKRPDLVLMDIMLPGAMDGIQAATQIRDQLGIPIVYLTALSDERTLQQIKVSDPFGYISKPFTASDLWTTIEIALHRHQMDRRLEESEARYRAVVEDQTELICRFLPDGTLTFVNEAYCRYFGKRRQELTDHSFVPLIPEEDQHIPKESIASLSPEDPIGTCEHRVVGADGEIRWQQWTNRAIFDKAGCLTDYQAVGRDITERRQAESQREAALQALRESEEKFRNLAEESPNMIFISKKGRVVYVNEKSVELMGFTREEFCSPDFDFRTLVAPEYADLVEAAFSKHMQGEDIHPYEYALVTRDGERIEAIIATKLIRYEGESAILGIITDITGRNRAEEDIRRRNQDLEVLYRASQAFTSTLDLNQVLATILEGMRYLLDVTGASVWLIDPDTAELVCRQASGPDSESVRGRRLALGQGIVGQVASSGESLIVPDLEADERHFKDMACETETKVRSALSVPLRAKRGVIGVICIQDAERDRFGFTDLRLIEALASAAGIAIDNAQLYAQLRGLAAQEERQRLARDLHDTVTQSLYSIGMAAHTSLRLLRETELECGVLGPIEHILALSQSALTDMREQLSGLHPTTLSEKGLIEALAEHCQVLRTRYLLSIALVADPEPPLSIVKMEALYYVAREALTNVVKYAGATQIQVSLMVEDDRVTLSVSDDGAGFDPSVLNRGDTMGLRTMKERTELLGGVFELESEPGKGTRVLARFPV